MLIGDEKFWMKIVPEILTAKKRKSFINEVYNEMAARAGMRISEGLTDEQLQEFETLDSNSNELNYNWLNQHCPDFRQHSDYLEFEEKKIVEEDFISELVRIIWLEQNKPDYLEIGNKCVEEVSDELLRCRDFILGK